MNIPYHSQGQAGVHACMLHTCILLSWLNPTVYHSELEVFSQTSLCFMSVLGGGIHLNSDLSELFNHADVLGESPPFQQFLLPHCYDVRPFGYDDHYKYEIVPGGEDYLGAL